MKRILGSLMAWVFAGMCFYAATSQAIVIEGTTPQGTFKAVGLDSSGAFRVATTTGIPQHVITDTTSVVSVLGPVEVKGNASATPVPVSGPGGGAVNVSGTFSAISVSTSGIAVSAHFNIAVTEVTVLAIDSTRKQSIVCNNDSSLTAWIGPTGVSTTNGIPLAAGACMSPDVPTSFVGQLVAIGTAAASGSISVIYFK